MSQPNHLTNLLASFALTALAATATATASATSPTCEAKSGARAPAVVELFTSQSCSSCPPADRWLSALKDRDGVLALSFHVNYWNHLGWQDRFASAATTERQHQIRAATGGRYVYTPQVVVNGKDHRNWPQQTAAALPRLDINKAPALKLQRSGNQVTAEVAATASATTTAGYWAVLRDGVVTRVTRGENAGETLRNDHIVTLYQPVAAWPSHQGAKLRLTLPAADNGETQRVVFVVTDASQMRPVQAVVLNCA